MAILGRLGRVLRARLGDDAAVRELLHELAGAVADEVADQLVERPRRAPMRQPPTPDNDGVEVDELTRQKARAAARRAGVL